MDALAYYQRRKGRKMNILVDGKVFLPQAFSRESEFETLVTELSDQIFGENTIYGAKQSWSDLVDGQMALRGRANSEIPVKATNVSEYKIFGLPKEIEV